jgi:hypothetical protein
MIPLPSLVASAGAAGATLSPSVAPISEALDAAAPDVRLNWMRSLGKREIAALWDLCAGRTVPVSYYAGAEGEIVVMEGENTLPPGLDRFQKHFVLRNGRIQGINVQRFSWLTGPGHFTVRPQDDGPFDEPGSAVFDYTMLPPDAPPQWPAVVPNDAGISTLVYAHMLDRMRRVSRHLTVGKAFKRGASANQFFVLLRPEPVPA